MCRVVIAREEGVCEWHEGYVEILDKHDYEDDFIYALQDFEYRVMREKADNVVLGFVATTGATGAIPIPFADAPLRC
jgi:hypothetical protein